MGPEVAILDLLPVHNRKKKINFSFSHILGATERGEGKKGATAAADPCLAYSQSSHWVNTGLILTRPLCLLRLSLAFGPQNSPNRPAQGLCLGAATWPSAVTGPGARDPCWAATTWTSSYAYPCDVSIPSENEGWSMAQNEPSLWCPQPGVCQFSSSHADKTGTHTGSRSQHLVHLFCCKIRFLDKASLMWSSPWSYWTNHISGSFPQLQKRSSGSFVLMSWLKPGSKLLWGR